MTWSAWPGLAWLGRLSLLASFLVVSCLAFLALPRLSFPSLVFRSAPAPSPPSPARGPCLLPLSNATSSFNFKFDINGTIKASRRVAVSCGLARASTLPSAEIPRTSSSPPGGWRGDPQTRRHHP
ncbi:hypothetical protein CGRA01v4_08895 [Colletotrichum graminicola]|nr:hypothetical protein CGRA01v4_08895 [Colletotrichum graminicola]